jgi:hypothetical protein
MSRPIVGSRPVSLSSARFFREEQDGIDWRVLVMEWLEEDLRKTPAAICPVTLHGAEDHDWLVVETVRNYYMDA